MGATATSTETTAKPIIGSSWPKSPGPSGNGSNGNGRRKWFRGKREFSKDTYRIATWILLAAIVMAFGVLGIAYLALAGGDQWHTVRMPRTFTLSTGLILGSSVTMEVARRQLHRTSVLKYSRWLWLTLLLGSAFVGSQLLGWRQLVREGVYLSSNPHSSFFYLFTGAHGLHLLGGMIAMSYLAFRARRTLIGVSAEKRLAATDSVALYWHFMDGLWVALFLLLLVWN
jgi:cytochrome c oxidase subunit III